MTGWCPQYQICLWFPRCDITFIVVHDCANLRTRICSAIVTIGIFIGSSSIIIIIVFAVFIISSRSIIGSDFSAKVNGEIVHSMKWILKGRVSQTNYSFIPLGIMEGNRRNGSSKIAKLAHYWASKSGILALGVVEI